MTDTTTLARNIEATSTKDHVASYLEDMLGQFQQMSLVAGYRTLAYLIDMARAEALALAKEKKHCQR